MPSEQRELTLRDLEDFEVATGADLFNIEAELEQATGARKLRILGALVWVHRRREQPDFTLDNARDMTLTELSEMADELIGLLPKPAGKAKAPAKG